MTDFEREDMELQAIMGDKFQDMSEAKQVPTNPKKAAQKPVQKPAEEESKDAEWHPVKPRNWMDGLKACVKWAFTFGGLNMLIFYWQQAGLMADSIAVPCMWVCCALAGYGVGLNVWRWSK